MINAKQTFLNQVRSRAAEELTAADMDRLTAILSDVLEGFRVEELKTDSWTANDDDLIASFVSSSRMRLPVERASQKRNFTPYFSCMVYIALRSRAGSALVMGSPARW